jgi:hypothetical protein
MGLFSRSGRGLLSTAPVTSGLAGRATVELGKGIADAKGAGAVRISVAGPGCGSSIILPV